MSEQMGEPRQMHHRILTWAHRSDSPRKIRTRGDQVGPADHLGRPNLAGLPSRCISTRMLVESASGTDEHYHSEERAHQSK